MCVLRAGHVDMLMKTFASLQAHTNEKWQSLYFIANASIKLHIMNPFHHEQQKCFVALLRALLYVRVWYVLYGFSRRAQTLPLLGSFWFRVWFHSALRSPTRKILLAICHFIVRRCWRFSSIQTLYTIHMLYTTIIENNYRIVNRQKREKRLILLKPQ